MNLYTYYISRMLALAAGLFFLMIIQSIGLGLGEKRHRADYEKLSNAVADPGSAHLEWIIWPPLTVVGGAYHGQLFRYCHGSNSFTHLYLKCQPVKSYEISNLHARGRRYHPTQATALNVFSTRVPWSKRSMDRRPLGFGSEPGIDLYQQTNAFFDPARLQNDLQRLSSLCSQDLSKK